MDSFGSLIPDISNNSAALVSRLIRTLRRAMVTVSDYRPYGIPIDSILHFLLAGMIFLVVSRWTRKRWAFAASLLLILIKEIIDVPMKAELAEKGVNLTADAIWDIAFGMAGLGAAWLFVAWRGDTWKVRPLGADFKPLRKCWTWEVSARTLQIGSSLALFIIVFAGLSLMIIPGIQWPHPVAAALVILGIWRFGPFYTMTALLFSIPFLNWFDYYVVAPHPVAASEISLMALAACCLVPLLRHGQQSLRLSVLDCGVIAFSICGTVAAAANLMRPSASVQGAVWLLRPIQSAIIYLVLTRLADSKRRVLIICHSIVCSLLLLCIAGIVEFIIKPLRLELVPGSAFGDAAAFGTYLTMGAPFALVLSVYSYKKLRWFSLAASLLSVICVGLVYSRTCWASVSVTTCLIIFIWGFRKDYILGFAICMALALAAFLGLYSVRSMASSSSSPHFVREVATILNPGSLRRSRWRMIEASINRIKVAPLAGQPGPWVEHYYLTLGANHGLPALAMAGVAFAIIVLRGIARLWSVRDRETFGIVAGGWLGLMGALIAGFALGSFARPTFIPLLWSLCAIVAICTNLTGTSFETLPQPKLPPLDSSDIPSKTIPPSDTDTSRRPIAFLVIALLCFLSIVAMLVLIFRS
jgi:hypothetical protein